MHSPRIFPYEKLTKYPHMKPEDVAVWEVFIEKYPNAFNSVSYDVCCGEGADFLPTEEDTPAGRENRLYKKKIDVVGYNGDTATIIEVKPYADFRGLGQIIGYHELYCRDNQNGAQPRKMLVCNEATVEMRSLYESNGIEVIETK